MEENFIDICPTCNQKVVLLKSLLKGDKIQLEGICLSGHEITFFIPKELAQNSSVEWRAKYRNRFMYCTVCGELVSLVSTKKKLGQQKLKIKCNNECNGIEWRIFRTDWDFSKCPHCGAPLDKEQMKRFRNEGFISCKSCNKTIMYSF